jgi:hypothetical protein
LDIPAERNPGNRLIDGKDAVIATGFSLVGISTHPRVVEILVVIEELDV